MATINLQDAWKVINLSLDITTDVRDLPSRKNGILSLLLSTANKRASRVKLGDVEAINKGDGKVYQVSRTFTPRLAPTTGNDAMQYCPTSGSELRPTSDVVKIDSYTGSAPILVSDELMRCIMQGKDAYISDYFRDYLRTHVNKLAVQVAAEAATKAGIFPKCDCDDVDVTCKDLPLFFSTIGFGVNPVGEAILNADAKEADLMNDFVLIGGTLLDNYMTAKGLASGNQLGFDASLMDISRAIYFDPNLATALGDADKILAMAPGALQMVTYAKHKGAFRHDTDTQKRVTVIDPWYGIEHDLLIYTNQCADEIEMYMQVSTNWTLVGLPDCAFEGDCFMDGVKDIFCYTVVCADTKFCDIAPACGSTEAATAIDPFCSSADTCEVFPVELLVFGDTNNDDDQDGGEVGLAGIVVEFYADVTETILVASATSAVATGLVNLNLPAGTYYVDVTAASVTAASGVVNVTLPWVLVITNTGTVLYPGWVEAAKIPIGNEGIQ